MENELELELARGPGRTGGVTKRASAGLEVWGRLMVSYGIGKARECGKGEGAVKWD